MDLPVWQELRTELHPKGLEIVTVALDTGGADAARPPVEAANPDHPSLLDEPHILDEQLGVVNVPNGVWIDEDGMIVRPVEPAHPRVSSLRNIEISDDMPDHVKGVLTEVKKIRTDPEAYINALRDWVDKGAESRFALAPDEVVRRSQPMSTEKATAAASFELGQHLHRSGKPDAAVRWFREAHRLDPDNWTYRRQAWSFVDALQGPNDVYEGDWVSDVRKIGAENYYPALDL